MKKGTAHKQNRFLNCLRIQIVPGHHEEQRINNIVAFCKKYKFDNVMLFLNSEDYNVGHMTIEEAKPWIETMKRAKERLTKEGITVSLNPWMEGGHLDRGRKLREGQDFVTICDYNGKKCELVTCMYDENWRAYFKEFYSYIVREIQPEVVWVEDDFRLHNHGDLEYGGCFCEHHMRAFNKVAGTDYSREEFVDRLFRKEPDEKVKEAFFQVNRSYIVDTAQFIADIVREANPDTKIGLMSSGHVNHSLEGRDWYGVHKAFANGGPMINRLHLPIGAETISTKTYYQRFNYTTFICRGYLPEECHILPELENATFSTFAKDAEMVRFQAESAIPVEIEGMTYDIYDFAGNGTIPGYGYGEALAEINDYMTAVADSGYQYRTLSGITFLLDEMNAKNRPVKNSFFDMENDDFEFGAILQGLGISARCSKDKEFENQLIVLGAGTTYSLTDEQLRNIFKNNKVILEGKSATLLIDRGLGDLIGAGGYEVIRNGNGIPAFEQIEGDETVDGIPGMSATASSGQAGDYVKLTYTETPVIRSRVYDYYQREYGLGIVETKGHLLVPYVVNSFLMEPYHPMRRQIIKDYVEKQKPDLALTDYSGVCAYYSKGENEDVLILVNSTLQRLKQVRFKLTGRRLEKLSEIDRDGVVREKAFSYDGEGYIVLDEPFEAILTKTFLLR